MHVWLKIRRPKYFTGGVFARSADTDRQDNKRLFSHTYSRLFPYAHHLVRARVEAQDTLRSLRDGSIDN